MCLPLGACASPVSSQGLKEYENFRTGMSLQKWIAYIFNKQPQNKNLLCPVYNNTYQYKN